MPLDAERAWSEKRMVSGKELRAILTTAYGPLSRVIGTSPSQPSSDYITRGGAVFGFINTVTEPFCGSCDRLRLTADGKLRNCLFGKQEWDIRQVIRTHPQADNDIHSLLDAAVAANTSLMATARSVASPERAMYQIGG